MQKKIIKKIIIAVLFGTLFSSCSKNFDDINNNPNATPVASPEQLLPPALVDVLTYNMIRNRGFNNELMQVTVDLGDGDGKVFRYDYRATWADYLYNGLYAQLSNIKDVYTISSKEGDSLYNKSYMGISLILQSWIYSILTDTYGDIPYFESNHAKDQVIFEPAFDPQKDIYLDIFKQLEEANTLLSAGQAIVPYSDPIYGGDVARWRKFGNSLYLRLLLRISGKSEVSQNCIAKIKEIIDGNPSAYPIISSNDESAILKWTGAAPYISPFVTNVREQDFRTPGIANFFIDHLAPLNDPCTDIALGTNSICRWRIATYQGSFQGVPSGYAAGDNPVKKSYFYSTTTNPNLMTEPLTGMIMNYAEVKFIMAEAALKGWINGSPEIFYKQGILNRFTLWIPNWPGDIDDWLTKADIQWDDSETFDQKMERIHMQKYYALFLEDLEQWFEYRRTGHPVLPKGTGLKNNGIMPARMTYPVYVQSTNPTNYKLAVAAQGPDEISTQVWWQKP